MHDTVTTQLRNLNIDDSDTSTDSEISEDDDFNEGEGEELGTDRSDDEDNDEDKESKCNSKKFPVADLSKILEVQGKHQKLTKERKQWRAWLREQCKNRLTEDVLASKQKENISACIRFINESDKSVWMGIIGAIEQLTKTWLTREIHCCHNK